MADQGPLPLAERLSRMEKQEQGQPAEQGSVLATLTGAGEKPPAVQSTGSPMLAGAVEQGEVSPSAPEQAAAEPASPPTEAPRPPEEPAVPSPTPELLPVHAESTIRGWLVDSFHKHLVPGPALRPIDLENYLQDLLRKLGLRQ